MVPFIILYILSGCHPDLQSGALFSKSRSWWKEKALFPDFRLKKKTRPGRRLMTSQSVTIEMKATEQHFPVVLFIILNKVVLTFEFVDEILKSNYSNKKFSSGDGNEDNCNPLPPSLDPHL